MDEQTLLKSAGDVLSRNLGKIIKSIYGIGKNKFQEQQLACGKAFELYLQEAILKYSRVKTLLYRDNGVFLYSFYEHLSLRHKKKTISTDNIHNVLEIGKNILITGSGGSGKSTLFKHLFLDTIHNTDLIPIFVELREINDLSDEASIMDCIYKSLTNLKFDLEKESFIKALDSGRFILFLDAFDEIEETKKRKSQQQIAKLCEKYNQNYFIVTSRELGEPSVFVGWNKFIILKVQPLNKTEALSLINNLNYRSEIKQKFYRELDQHLYKKYTSFASNPLLLTIMLLTYDQYAEIPDKIHLFYQECFHTLYNKHDASKGGFKRDITSKLPLDDFSRLLSYMSALSYIRQVQSFNLDSLITYIHEASEQEEISVNPISFKNDLTEATCLLIQEGLEFVYTHRSFQEYFSAKYLSNVDDKEQQKLLHFILNHLPNSFQNDIVISLLFEMNKSRLERNLIIPFLKDLRQKITAETEQKTFFNYIKLIYSKIYIDLSAVGAIEGVETIEDAVFFSTTKDEKKYSTLLNWLYLKYSPFIQPRLSKGTDKIEIIKKYAHILGNTRNDYGFYFEEDEEETEIDDEEVEITYWEIPIIDKILEYPELLNDILKQSNYSLLRLKYALQVLDHLENKLRNNPSLSDLIKLPPTKKRK